MGNVRNQSSSVIGPGRCSRMTWAWAGHSQTEEDLTISSQQLQRESHGGDLRTDQSWVPIRVEWV